MVTLTRVRGRGVVAALVALVLVLGLHLAAPFPACSDTSSKELGKADGDQSSSGRIDGPKVLGKTIGEWSAIWWQWAFIEPPDSNPLLDTTGEFADKNQKGPVWFLAGFSGSGEATRDVTIPQGKYILFPIVNFVDISGNPPMVPPDDEATWRQFLMNNADPFANLVCTLDGTPVVFNPNTPIVRTQSPTFSVTLGKDNIFSGPPGKYADCWSDGYWVMLSPLSPGKHSLHFFASAQTPNFDLVTQNVTYNLTVKGKGSDDHHYKTEADR
jgi:hypothetical protein